MISRLFQGSVVLGKCDSRTVVLGQCDSRTVRS